MTADPDESMSPAAPAMQSTSRARHSHEKHLREEGSRRVVLLVVRLSFFVLLVTTAVLLVATRASSNESFSYLNLAVIAGSAVSVGVIVLVIDIMTPNKRLAALFGTYLGVCLGLIGSLALGALLETVVQAWELVPTDPNTPPPVWIPVVKAMLAITLSYIAVSIVLTTRNDFRFIIPYVEFKRQRRGAFPILVDTSALVDGRVQELGLAGVIDAPLSIPSFVLDELQRLADSSERGKRARGKRGLDVVQKLQANALVDLSIEEFEMDVGGRGVDRLLVELAQKDGYRILTTDANLEKIASIGGVGVINLNALAVGLRVAAIPGDILEVEVLRSGDTAAQGVGYLDDGTMVVIENGERTIGTVVRVQTTNSVTTASGRIIFAKVLQETPESGSPASVTRLATEQPKWKGPPPPQRSASDRNPRR
ncbi:MAG: TRAM domain-containing protein [Phycisphaerales bacterium]|nr:TRAM domain-containing protein [Phycisphaerales bacterium]